MDYKNLDACASYDALKSLEKRSLKDLLCKERIEKASIYAGGGLNYNFASMPVDKSIVSALKALFEEQGLIEKYKALLSGQVMNPGEKRLVLHQLTRGQCLDQDVNQDGENKRAFYEGELLKIKEFSNKVRNGEILSASGKKFDTVCQIGIGGSDLGPRALYLALTGTVENRIDAKFISNVDPDDAAGVMETINPETTLFILVSKSGTTLETLTNRDLVFSTLKGIDPSKQLVAVTSKTSPLAKSKDVLASFFIDDYIGGRYSSTSAVGAVVLSVALGFDTFSQLLEGAHEADLLALNEDLSSNAAAMDALIGVYLRNVLELPTTAILPYSQQLSRFPAHLQQLDMESNGKHVSRDGEKLSYVTGPVIFGEPGTNGQHSFFQLLHQGTDTVPLQFIGFKNSQFKKDVIIEDSTSQVKLNANLVAQIVAFALGKADENTNKEFDGDRFSSLLYADELTAKSLGALLAHYENKVMFQGFVWNLNSFDQEGVQLGKVLAGKVLAGCKGDDILKAYSNILI